MAKTATSKRISDKVYNFCRNPESVSSLLAKDPSLSPAEAATKLYNPKNASVSEGKVPAQRTPASAEDLQRAYECGKWGPTRPSELFLRIFADSLGPLNYDPLMGCVSPSLVGSCGAIPLTIFAPLPDICRHMSNLIARAEKEVFLATNYWMDSDGSRLLTDALKELSKRAGARGERAVVKIMYDRGSPWQLIDNHQVVSEQEYTGKSIRLPSKEEAPYLDMEVVNYHRPVLGTFHAKFMVVDRKIAVVSSNNIQDNDNVEMMAHLEGPIVDGLYDTLLISWQKKFEPALPAIGTPAAEGGLSTFKEASFQKLFDENGKLHVRAGDREHLRLHAAGDPRYDPDLATEYARMQSAMTPRNGEKMTEVVSRHLNLATKQDRKATAPEHAPGREMTPYMPHAEHELFPMALVNRPPYGPTNNNSVYTPQNEAWLSAIRNARSTVFIQTPNLNAAPLLPELLAAVRRGINVTYYVCLGYNDAGELLPFQGGHNEGVSNKLYLALKTPAERSRLHIHYYVGKDQTQPIHNKFKARSCHVKLMIVDDHIGIIGSGNQDTQSWFHSQEVNVLIDSREVVTQWIEGIDRNQNTAEFGKASQEDGIWRDKDGKEAEGAIGKDPGYFGWTTGITTGLQRVRGAVGI